MRNLIKGAAMCACAFATAFVLTAHWANIEPPPVYEVRVTDARGGLFIAGSGDDCRAAWHGVQFPPDYVEAICIEVRQ